MTSSQSGAVIAGIFAVIGNVVTAFGPHWLAWGQRPRYLQSDGYNALKKNYPQVEQRLDDMFAESKPYYESRQTRIKLVRLEEQNTVFCLHQTTRVVNIFSHPIEYNQPVDVSAQNEIELFRIADASGVVKDLDLSAIRHLVRTSSAGGSSLSVSQVLSPNATYTIDSVYLLRKPRNFGQESLTLGHTLLRDYTMFLSVPTRLQHKINFEIHSLSFLRDLSINDDHIGTLSTTIPGMMVTGQGVELDWRVDDEKYSDPVKAPPDTDKGECVESSS